MRRFHRVGPRLWLDTAPPAITITAPGSNTVDQPVLQLQGCANEDLYSISYDLSNAAGFVSNQDVLVLDRAFDTNQWRLRTNTFQAFDIGLTPGSNTITLHAMDWAGNQTNANFVYVLDYSGKTNPPALALYWPANGAVVSGGSFTLRGAVDDPTVTLSAQITDTSGDTNVAGGIVERNGNFWVENLPLASGSNCLTLTATDATGSNVTVTNIAIFQSSVGLSIDTNSVGPITNQPTVSVSGTVDSGYTVWVNGALATNDGYGNWTALNVPVNGAGTAVLQARAIPNSQTNGATAGGGGTSSTLQNPGNPTPSGDYLDAEFAPDTVPCIIVTQLHQSYYETNDNQVLNSGGTRYSSAWTGDWTLGSSGDILQWILYPSGSFDWDDETWDASGTGTDQRGSSGTFGDYSTNSVYMTDSITEPDGEFVDREGSLPVETWLEEFLEASGTFGSAYDYDNSACIPAGDTNVNDYDSGAITGHATTRLSYLPGGKSVPVQYVVALTSLAVGKPIGTWYTYANWDWSYIPATNYTLAGLPLATNGILYEDYDAIAYKVVPSGSPPFDITPSFDGGPGAATTIRAWASGGTTSVPPTIVDGYYEFIVGAKTYRAAIQASASGASIHLPLTNSLPFCVGEYILFQLYFEPVLASSPPLTYSNILNCQWTLPPNFYNRSNYIGPKASPRFTLDTNLLKTPTTSCWYYDTPGGIVSFKGIILLSNGGTASIAPQGKLPINKPSLFNYISSNPGAGLVIIDQWPWLACSPAAAFSVSINSEFDGLVGVTQLITGQDANLAGKTNMPGWNLDTVEFPTYFTTLPPLIPVSAGGVVTTTSNFAAFKDQPCLPCGGITMLNEGFIDYVRFQPAGASANLFVTLGIVNWHIDAGAFNMDISNTSSTNYIILGTPDVKIDRSISTSDAFPMWTNTCKCQ